MASYVCPVCKTEFRDSRSLYIHRRDDHRPDEVVPYNGRRPQPRLSYTKDMAVPKLDGVPTCAKCGGTQFTARRKTSTKVMFGFYSLAGKPHHVECEVCGARYRRPNV